MRFAPLMLFCGLLLAPGAAIATPSPTPTIDPTSPLFWVESSGGMCPTPCGHSLHIYLDGHFEYKYGRDKPIKGKLPQARIDKLKSAILATDFKALAAKDFPGNCPHVDDGDSIEYFFNTPQGLVTLIPCYEAPTSHAPVMLLQRQLGTEVEGIVERLKSGATKPEG